MRRWTTVALFVAALTVAVAACGDEKGGEKTFDDPSFAISFKYPDEFEFADDVSASITVGGAPKRKSKGVRLDDKNGIVLQQFDLNAEVTEKNVEQVKPELDAVVRQGARNSIPGKRITAGGLPGYQYEFDVSQPAGARSRLAVLFDGKREYTVNCQSTKSKRRKVENACQKALDTLKAR